MEYGLCSREYANAGIFGNENRMGASSCANRCSTFRRCGKDSCQFKPVRFQKQNIITSAGQLDGNKFVLNFTEKGKLRETRGIFTGEFEGDTFSGSFSSTASDSKGKISGFKV